MVSGNIPKSERFLQEQEAESGLQLGQFVDVLKRRALLIIGITALTVVAAVAKSANEKPTYSSQFELLTPPVTLETEIISTINPEALSNQSEAVGVGVIDETKLKILTSPRVMNPIVDDLRKIYPNISYGEVKNGLTITPNDQGKTLTVKYKSGEPGKVVDVLDAVSKGFLRYSLEDRQSDITRGVAFVDEQLPAVRARVTDLESQLEQLRQSESLIDPVLQGEQLSAQMAKFTSDQLELQVLIDQTTRLYDDVDQELTQSGELASASALLESPRYQSLLDQLLEVDNQLADDRTLYLDSSPEIAVTLERRENIKPLLAMEGVRVREQVGSVIRELNTRNQALSRSISELDSRIKRLSFVAREYNTIQRDLGIATSNLNEFLTKREALRIDAAQRQTPWEILIPHDNPQPSKGSISQNAIIGMILGLLLGSAVAIALERLNNRIYTVKELKRALQMPVLGAIPHGLSLQASAPVLSQRKGNKGFAQYSNGYRQDQSRSFTEAFIRLSNNIDLNNLDNHINSLTVSSALPNEGKSTISFYLAQASASLGKRTLLVDADLQHPTLHKLCDVSNEKGLSNYLTGEVSLVDSLINLTTDENLFFMPSGPVPSDSAKVLSSKSINNFYQQIYKTFDLVIFDTPPLLGFADAFMVAKRTNGLLLASRLGQVKFSQIEAVLDELYVSKIPVIGAVANDVTDDGNDVYGYYNSSYRQLDLEPLPQMDYANSAVSSDPSLSDNNRNGRVDDRAPWKKTIQNIWGK